MTLALAPACDPQCDPQTAAFGLINEPITKERLDRLVLEGYGESRDDIDCEILCYDLYEEHYGGVYLGEELDVVELDVLECGMSFVYDPETDTPGVLSCWGDQVYCE